MSTLPTTISVTDPDDTRTDPHDQSELYRIRDVDRQLRLEQMLHHAVVILEKRDSHRKNRHRDQERNNQGPSD